MTEEKQPVVLNAEDKVKGFMEKVRRQDPLRHDLWQTLMEAFVLKKPDHDEHFDLLNKQKAKIDEITKLNGNPTDVYAAQAAQIGALQSQIAQMQAMLAKLGAPPAAPKVPGSPSAPPSL